MSMIRVCITNLLTDFNCINSLPNLNLCSENIGKVMEKNYKPWGRKESFFASKSRRGVSISDEV